MSTTSTKPEFDPRALAEGLVQGEHGIWFAREKALVSYFPEGNAKCYELEEKSFWFLHRADCLCAVVRCFPPAGEFFDIGGGNGFLAAKLMKTGFSTVVVEPGESGARNAAGRGLPAVICATLATAHFRSESMSAAGVFDVLEHIDDDGRFLREVHRCLTPGGRIFLTVPASDGCGRTTMFLPDIFTAIPAPTCGPDCETAGFRMVYATYLFSLLPLPLLVMRGIPSVFGRRPLAPKSYAGLHRPRARGCTDRVWMWELDRIRRGRAIPFGSSCLAVGEKL